LFERQLVDNAKRRGVSVEKLSEDLAAGKTVLKDYSRQGKAKVKRVMSTVPDMPKANPLAGTGIPSGEELAQKGLMSRPRVVPGSDAGRPSPATVLKQRHPRTNRYHSGYGTKSFAGEERVQHVALPQGQRLDLHTSFFDDDATVPDDLKNSVYVDWLGNTELQRGTTKLTSNARLFDPKEQARNGLSREDLKALRDHLLEQHPGATHAVWERLTKTPAKDGRFVRVNLRTGKTEHIDPPSLSHY
jgi:hypothetical protein